MCVGPVHALVAPPSGIWLYYTKARLRLGLPPPPTPSCNHKIVGPPLSLCYCFFTKCYFSKRLLFQSAFNRSESAVIGQTFRAEFAYVVFSCLAVWNLLCLIFFLAAPRYVQHGCTLPFKFTLCLLPYLHRSQISWSIRIFLHKLWSNTT